MIIKQNDVWDETYLPEKILFRSEQLERIEYNLQGIFKYGRPRNILCLGDYGTGKTACVRYVLKQMEDKTAEKDISFKVHYFNCANFTQFGRSITVNSIISDILLNNNIKGIYSTLSWDIKFDKFKNYIRNFTSFVLILDEVDLYLSQKRNDFQNLAYIISRSLPGTSLLLISNKFWVPYFLQELDPRVVDTFTRRLTTIAFNEYSVEELYGILADRSKIGLYDGSYDENILEYISEISFERGLRARGIIDITREAALLAEKDDLDRIDFLHVNKAANISYEQELKKIIKTLDPPAVVILGLILNNGGTVVEKEIFEEFKKRTENGEDNSGISRATFFNVVSRLKGMEIIRSEIKGKGKSRRAILHINEEYSSIAEAGIREAIEDIKSSKISNLKI
jgi:cell division control protein 6